MMSSNCALRAPPAGRPPHRGGDRLAAVSMHVPKPLRQWRGVNDGVISPLVGEMGGSPEGGAKGLGIFEGSAP
jgi:hypothetical protein